MKKKLLAVLLAAAMTASLAACGGKSDTPSDTGTPVADDSSAADDTSSNDEATDNPVSDDTEVSGDTAAASDDPWADVDTSEHVVITYMTTGDAPSGTKEKYDEMMAKLNEILTEKVNAELDINFISWTDYLSNYNLTLARMDGTVDLVGTGAHQGFQLVVGLAQPVPGFFQHIAKLLELGFYRTQDVPHLAGTFLDG